MQDGATKHTANYSTNVLNKVFEDRLISRGLRPARSPDLNPCDFYLWGNLKYKVYSNNPHTLVELKQNSRETISSIEGSELKLVSNNVFKRLEACLRAVGRLLSIYCDGESFKQCITFRNAHTCLQCAAYQARGGSNFPLQMTRAFRTHKPTAKESGECVLRGIPCISVKLCLKVIFGRKREEVAVGWGKLHNVRLHKFLYLMILVIFGEE
jgi:hypothetical protein